MSDERREEGGVTRLSFLKVGAAAAAGAAAIGAPVAAAALSKDKAGVPTESASENPSEPVMAYVRDERLGEVTVMSGTNETTYRDPALAKRLLAAAPKQSTLNGGIDVLTP